MRFDRITAPMAHWAGAAAFGLLVSVTAPVFAGGLGAHGGEIVEPESSHRTLDDVGKRAHTAVRMFVPLDRRNRIAPPTRDEAAAFAVNPQGTTPPYAGYYYLETPASLACVYKLVTQVAGCNPYQTTALPTGGSKVIAIVGAYDYPTAAADLAAFSKQFGLAAPTLQVIYAAGYKPAYNSGWAFEAALDIEWAHAMAPKAKIILVEAASNSYPDLMKAVSVASTAVAQAGGGQVSMSWGSGEFAGETSYDGYFTTPKVVYIAAAGDSAGVMYPAASPNVVSVGGTTLSRNPSTGKFQGELSWDSTGGGQSAYEPLPTYQTSIAASVGITKRATPDIAAVADPVTGVWVYMGGKWYIAGGTSVAAPVMAGIINLAGQFRTSTAAELTAIYGNTSGFLNITSGACGPYQGYLAGAGFDFCTGHGTPTGLANK